MPVGRINTGSILTTSKEALEGGRVDPGLAELPRSLRSWGKSFDNISARFSAFTNGLESRRFTGPSQSLQPVDAVG